MRLNTILLTVVAIAFGAATFTTPAAAQAVPADAVLRDFQITGTYLLEVDGEVRKKAKIYQSRTAAAILLRTSAFETPVLLSPREGQVQSVSVMSLSMQDDGDVDILADAYLEPLGRFKVEGEVVGFTVGSKQAKLKPNPPLTGSRRSDELFEHSPDYVLKAANYTPHGPSIEALKARKQPVKMKIFFGSWCAFCSHNVPRLLKVQQQLEGANIEIEYYGLPKPPFKDDTEAQKAGVASVPTGIVYVGGKEVGRIQREQWNTPERSLLQILQGS